MRRMLCALALICLLITGVQGSVSAYNPLQASCNAQGGAGNSSSACAKGVQIVGSNGVLRKVSTIIATVAGIAAVIVVIVGGLQYVLSAGDAQKAASARSAIIGGVVGLAIIVSAQGILLFVLSNLQ